MRVMFLVKHDPHGLRKEFATMDPTQIIASMRDLINYGAFVSIVLMALVVVMMDDRTSWLLSLILFLLCIACAILVGTA